MRYFHSPHHQAISFAVIIAVLMLVPGGAMPPVPTYDWADKAVHLLVFLVMTVLAIRSFRALKRFKRPVLSAAAATLAYAVVLDLAQAFVPGRFWDPVDVLAGALGVGAAMLLQSRVDRS